MKYGIRDKHGSGIRILALGSGLQQHEMFEDQGSESNKNLGSGIKILKKNEITSDNYTMSQPCVEYLTQ